MKTVYRQNMTYTEKDQMVDKAMRQLIDNHFLKITTTDPPELLELMQLLHKKKIISLQNGTVTPLKPANLKQWNNHNTIEKYLAYINRMEKNTLGKKKSKAKNKEILKWIISIALIAVISFLVKRGLNELFEKEEVEEIHQLSVFVTDLQGNVVLEHTGEVNTSLGNSSLRGTIGEDGRVNFDDLQKSYIGDTIQLGFKAEGWRLVNPDTTYVFTGDPIKLKIRRDLGTIKGTVKNRRTGEYLKGAAVRINTDTIIYTDSSGVFKIDLPLKYQVPDLHHRYNLEASAAGYEPASQLFQPLSTPADIRLDEK